MINANIYSVCESVDNKGYSILLSIVSLDRESNNKLKYIDELLNSLFGEEGLFYKKSKRNIVKVNSLNFCLDYYVLYDIDLIMDILELFTCMKDCNAFLGYDFIMPEQVCMSNRKELYFKVSEFMKIGIIELNEEKRNTQLIMEKIL